MISNPTNFESPTECSTLIFKHLPPELTDGECSEFLTSLGAASVHYVGNHGPLKNCAIADFPSMEHAWKVIRGVHQRAILGKRLVVEFFKSSKQSNHAAQHTAVSSSSCDIGPWLPVPTPLAPKWDLSLPFSPSLCYRYPSPTENILTNIVRVMISCSAFYTQVLHLMNRLHLPPPFGDCDLFPGNLTVVPENTCSTVNVMKSVVNEADGLIDDMDLSGSSESELESSETEHVPPVKQPSAPKNTHKKRRLSMARSKVNLAKQAARTLAESGGTDLTTDSISMSKFHINIPQQLTKHVDGKERRTRQEICGFGHFEPPTLLEHTSISVEDIPIPEEQPSSVRSHRENEFMLRKKPPKSVNKQSIIHESSTNNATDRITNETIDEKSETDEEDQPPMSAYSINELRLRRLTHEERENYSVFTRNYAPGEPTSRLYVKNLAPSITERDLYKIFGAFQYGAVSDLDYKPTVHLNSTDRFAIRLLTVGRMKGQAFISLDCDLTASQALEATNGLLLHDRPMVVQYARGAKAKVDEKSLITSV